MISSKSSLFSLYLWKHYPLSFKLLLPTPLNARHRRSSIQNLTISYYKVFHSHFNNLLVPVRLLRGKKKKYVLSGASLLRCSRETYPVILAVSKPKGTQKFTPRNVHCSNPPWVLTLWLRYISASWITMAILWIADLLSLILLLQYLSVSFPFLSILPYHIASLDLQKACDTISNIMNKFPILRFSIFLIIFSIPHRILKKMPTHIS